MFKRKLTASDYLLIIVNLIPLYCVWFEGWNASLVFLVYCLETVIIGIVNVLKMACVTIFVRKKDDWQNAGSSTMRSGWFFIIFFIAHYGFFVFVQTQIFFNVSNLVPDGSFLMTYSKIPELLGHEGKLLLLIFIVYYTLQNVLIVPIISPGNTWGFMVLASTKYMQWHKSIDDLQTQKDWGWKQHTCLHYTTNKSKKQDKYQQISINYMPTNIGRKTPCPIKLNDLPVLGLRTSG